MTTVRETELPDLLYRGKVRDTYDWGGGRLLMVATDRISAFDVVLPTGIPEKGAVLCQISAFWFDRTSSIIPNHMVSLANDEKELPRERVRLIQACFLGQVGQVIFKHALVVGRLFVNGMI